MFLAISLFSGLMFLVIYKIISVDIDNDHAVFTLPPGLRYGERAVRQDEGMWHALKEREVVRMFASGKSYSDIAETQCNIARRPSTT